MSLPPLDPTEFAAYFSALWAQEPFPWQQRLASQVCTQGTWPAGLDLPTAAGKTATIDIAVFHLAWAADQGAARRAAARIAFVVDRRLVVDSAYERAQELAGRLADAAEDGGASGSILGRVAARLLTLAETGGPPLRVARLRGGMPREPDWARTPAQPTVLLSTVDQVGSRLLFRGYGVSDSMKPVHAGLLGTDTLLLLDEAHLSQPFAETCQGLRRLGTGATGPAVVALSATPTGTQGERFGLDQADSTSATLQARLEASKPARLVPLTVREADIHALAAAYVEEALALAGLLPGAGAASPAVRRPVVAVVVNRVRRARVVFETLRSRLASAGLDGEADVVLLTGRVRDLDRDAILKDYLPRMRAQRTPDPSARPLFVVATQCIEAGADLDFDTLVTEIAPLDSLRQRFGRLNRLGRPLPAAAAILAARDQRAQAARDAVYGTASAGTWAYLEGVATGQHQPVVDFGITGFRVPPAAELAPLLAPRAQAPVLLPAHQEAWRQTAPVPAVDPDPALFLHGPAAGPAEVSVVWRADLPPVDTAEAARQQWMPRVQACPPVGLEALTVPIWEAHRLLGGVGAAGRENLADVEGLPEPEGQELRRGRPALRWTGSSDQPAQGVLAEDVRPGDVLVVPASYGGSDRWGWDPATTRPVADIAELAILRARGRLVLRVCESLLVAELARLRGDMAAAGHAAAAAEAEDAWARLARALDALRDAASGELVDALLAQPELPPRWQIWLASMRQHQGRLEARWLSDPREVIVAAARPVPRAEIERLAAVGASAEVGSEAPSPPGGEAATEDDRGSFAPRRAVGLQEHSRGVADRARAYAAQAGLAPDLQDDLELAGLLHDAGKAEPAFQVWLAGGDELAAWAEEPLAKSGLVRPDDRAARRRAGLPSGARHEVGSVLLALEHPRLADAHDPELVLYLVGTHHGHGRPCFPPVRWPGPMTPLRVDLGDGPVMARQGLELQRLDSGWIELVERVTTRHGAWALAHLEAVLRLADHRQSEAEQAEEQ